MTDLYSAYKPFRNYMRQFSLVPSLLQLWGYFLCITENQPLPPSLARGKPPHFNLNRYIYPWDLEILVREVILNADTHGNFSLEQWNKLADAVNHIRRIENLPSSDVAAQIGIMVELQRIPHRQFRWQSGQANRGAQIVRAWKIFGSHELNKQVRAQVGVDMEQLLRLSMAITGSLLKRPLINIKNDYSTIGIPPNCSRHILERITCDLPTLRSRTRDHQQYNDAWLYATFPLEHTPLIRLDPAKPNELYCPIPRYLFNRLTSGVFYDIINNDGFAKAYGKAFESYVGEVITATLPSPPFQVKDERPYAQSKANLKHGVDWIVSDGTGHLFIECKTKRLSLGSKNLTDPETIKKDLAAMKLAVIQNYKNILDAKKGITNWKPDNSPVYSLIVTLEDWHLFSPYFTTMLHDEVKEELKSQGMDQNLVTQIPYTIASSSELEIALQIVSMSSIEVVFSLKTDPNFWLWTLSGFLPSNFSTYFQNAKVLLFPEELKRIVKMHESRSDSVYIKN